MSKDEKDLGAPLLANNTSIITYKFLVEKMHTKLQGWENSFLSHAGREILIKSSQASIPTFQMELAFSPRQSVR